MKYPFQWGRDQGKYLLQHDPRSHPDALRGMVREGQESIARKIIEQNHTFQAANKEEQDMIIAGILLEWRNSDDGGPLTDLDHWLLH